MSDERFIGHFDWPADVQKPAAPTQSQEGVRFGEGGAEYAKHVQDTAEAQKKAEAERRAEEDRLEKETLELDDAHRTEVVGEVVRDWGAQEYLKARETMKRVIETMPPDVREVIKNARLEDGRAIFNTRPGMELLRRLGTINDYREKNFDTYRNDRGLQREYLELMADLVKLAGVGERPSNWL